MKLSIEWSRPVSLRNGSRENLIYTLDPNRLPQAPGVYIFGRKWGTAFEALYIGKAVGIRGRVKNQLNNLRLMKHMKDAKTGKRIALAGWLMFRPGQQAKKTWQRLSAL